MVKACAYLSSMKFYCKLMKHFAKVQNNLWNDKYFSTLMQFKIRHYNFIRNSRSLNPEKYKKSHSPTKRNFQQHVNNFEPKINYIQNAKESYTIWDVHASSLNEDEIFELMQNDKTKDEA